MNEQISAPDRTYAAAEPPFAGYGAAPEWTPLSPAAFAAPTAAKRTFRDRMVTFRGRAIKLWVALAVAAVTLAVGLGLGAMVGHATAGSGTGQLQQPPGIGRGFDGQDGQGFGGRGPDDQGLDGQTPGTQSGGQSGSSGSSGQSGTGSGTTSGTTS